MSPLTIRILGEADAEAYRTIRLRALLTAPEAFGSLHAIEAKRPLADHAARLASTRVFVAYDGSEMVGMAGFARNAAPKEAHKGFLWGFYVDPATRGQGVGTTLLAAVLEHARTSVEQVTLTAVEGNTPALALYEKAGFSRYGLEPRALKTPSGYANEVLMALLF